ncbi:MAG: VirD4-like conjugal transfer protein, CD1115 family [Faecalibacterium sp.]
MTTKKLTKLLALYLPYILLGLVATNFGEAWRLAEGKELSDKIMSMMGTVPLAFANPLPSLHPLDLLVGLCCGAGLRLAVYLREKNAKKYRHGMEYGSARWGTPKDIEPFMAPKFADNIILTKTERLMMSNRPPDPKNARNKNVLVVGGSGSGKTRFWLKPNLLQCHSSYVVTDPKGSIVVECGNALLQKGYKLKIFNTINFSKSMKYNPMAYIHSEKDILKLVTALMTNTKGEGQGGDPFWDKAERLLLVSLIAYLHYEAPVEEQNFATLLEMLNTMQVSEDDETYQNPVDLLFEDLGKKKPKSFAVRQYKLYKLAADKTAKSILISCGARLAPFDIQELRDLTMYDELQLDTLGDKKTALFLIMSDTDSTFNFLISMVYTQLFNLLCDKADDVYGGKLPIHVRCLIDECANIGQIPNLEKLVATIRSREISACLVLQARSQLKAIYKDNADTIVGNMDSQIFLGGSEPTTLKDLSEMLGKETIDAFNTSDTRGNSPSYGTTFQKMGHELLSRDEIAVLDGGKCILQLRGVRPFLSDKYDLTQHPNYKLTSDYDPKNTFDIEKYLNRKEKIHSGDEFIVVDADSLPSA